MTGSRAADCVDHASGLHIGESMFFTSTSILYVYRDVFFWVPNHKDNIKVCKRIS